MNDELTDAEKRTVLSILSQRRLALWTRVLSVVTVLVIMAVALMAVTDAMTQHPAREASSSLFLYLCLLAVLIHRGRQMIIIQKLARIAQPDLTIPIDRSRVFDRNRAIFMIVVVILAFFLVWNILH